MKVMQQYNHRFPRHVFAGVLAFMISTILFPLTADAKYINDPKWQDVCPDSENIYCQNIGKQAYNSAVSGATPIMRTVPIGKIVGVRWLKKGTITNISEAIPEAKIKQEVRKAQTDGYFYLVDDPPSGGDLIVMEVKMYDAK